MPNLTDMLYRWRLPLTGFNGGPGLCTFYTSQDSSVVSAANGFFRTFFEAVKAVFPTTLTVNYPASIDAIDPVTGFVGAPAGVSSPAATVGTGTSTWVAGGSGVQVRWHTDAYSAALKPPHGHTIVVGSTYLVPAVAGVYAPDGTLDPTTVTLVTTAANAMKTSFAGNLRVWSRPIIDSSGTTLRSGCSGAVLSVSVLDRVAQLKSRRP